VEKAFGRRLKEEWWSGLKLRQAILSETYRAGAILTEIDNFIYLDKFAVVEAARGEGLSRTVWLRFAKDHPLFFWRSQTANGFNAFYNDVCTGSVKIGDWTVYWSGDIDMVTLSPIVERIAALPESFAE